MTIASSITLATAALTAAGGKWPTAVAKALAERDTLTTAVAALPTGHGSDLGALVADALLANRDPLTDAAVVRVATAKGLAGESGNQLVGAVQRTAETRVVAAMVEAVDEILASFKKGVDAAGQTLAAAHELLGDTALDDAATVARLGPAATEAWGNAKNANNIIRSVTKGWYALAELTGQMSGTPSKTLQLAAVSLDEFEQLGRAAEPWSIIGAGIVVNMADRTTIREREQNINAERDQNQDAAFGRQYKLQHGIAS